MKRKNLRARALALLTAGLVAGGGAWSMQSATAQVPPEPVFDHLKCYPVRDGLRNQLYTADLVPLDDSVFVTENGDAVSGTPRGCRIQVPAREFCTAVSKENARDVRTGVAP